MSPESTDTPAPSPAAPPRAAPAAPSRRAALLGGGVAAAALVLPRPLRAAEFEYKYASNLPAVHPLNLRMTEAAGRIREKTGGRVNITVFPNNQLGSDTDVLGQLRSGAVELFTLSGLILSTLVPAASINGVGFAFPDYPTVWKAMDGELGAHVRAQIARTGSIVAFERIWDNGFRQITSATKPINGPEDLKGFKIRVPVSPLWTSMFKALEAAPASINFSEVYSALQTKVVDGQENPLAIISTAKLFEVQKYLSVTNHMWDGFWMLANKRAFEALPADARAVVEAEINAAALLQRADVAALNATLRGELTGKGMTFNEPPVAAFRERLKAAGFYAEWKGKYGEQPWALLEGAVGALG